MIGASVLREGLLGLVRYPLRTALSLLGLVVGVSSVVGSLALLLGAHRFALASAAERTRLDVVTLESPADVIRNGRVLSVAKPVRLTPEDVERVRSSVPGVLDAMAYSEETLPVRYEGIAFDVPVYGVEENARTFLPMQVAAGRFFSREESREAARVAVLTRALAADLFGRPVAAVGREMLISGQRFDVAGIVDVPKEPFSGDDRRGCYVPYRTEEERLLPSRLETQVFVRAASTDQVAAVRDGLELLASRLRPGVGLESFVIQTSEEEIRAARIEAGIRALTLGGVALLALLVAGGGILNTLLVGVKERTREIGTRRALGATRAAIRGQFLFEALALSVPGALLGVAVGALLARSLGEHFASGLYDPSLLHVAVGVPEGLAGALAAVLVAAGAGLVPAWRASNVDPAEALRYE